MQYFLQLFIWVPLAALLITFLIPQNKERIISALSISVTGIQLAGVLIFSGYWMISGSPVLDIKHIVFFKSDTIEIFIDLYFDKVTAVFAATGSLLVFLVAIFSRYYLHREEGFKRYFCTLLIFFLGYNFVIFSGNFETLFIGWELLGICSFLLIGFYRDRFLPVKNALKVISVYRLGDVCLILAMWMSHHLWHENITFIKLNDVSLVTRHLQEYHWYAVFVACMILIGASAKSAQLPFSSWLPRAMEGPTTSSAIFYGSLSVHLGVFLLLRTDPYWQNLLIIKIIIIVIGLATGIIATGIAKVQSTVKTQIAYSSIAQIGLMFIEVALGLHVLALVHFAANAFLRTYQFLVSPSVLSYMVHDMFFNFRPRKQLKAHPFMHKITNSFYILSVKEWNLDALLHRFLWNPFKLIGNKLHFLSSGIVLIILGVIYLFALTGLFYQHLIPVSLLQLAPAFISVTGLLLILKSFAHRGDAIAAWGFITAGHLFVALSIALYSDAFSYNQVFIYLSGTLISVIAGYLCLRKIKSTDNNIDLNQYHGYTYENPKLAFVFLLACLGFAGLPFTPTFIGIDLLFSHIGKDEVALIIFTSLNFIFIELSLLRIYSRVFLGQHKKAYHPMAFKYS